MNIYEYSSDYIPAAPTCQIHLGSAGGQPILGPIDALIDTGSDISVVPLAYLRQIKAKRISRGQARTIWGDSRVVDIYIVSFALHELRISTLQVLADDQSNEIVLGRRVINRLKLMLDGPAAQTEILESI